MNATNKPKLGEGSTPGPWTVEHANTARGHRVSIGANRCETSYLVVADIPASQRCENDAKLISRAPLLIKAREVLDNVINQLEAGQGLSIELINLRAQASALLAKFDAQ
jgi:hypothetical protein